MLTKNKSLKTHFRPKKSLGQNFLNDPKAIAEILLAGDIQKADLILEIGPGKGVLTEAILESGAKLLAIEKDIELLPILKQRFEKELSNQQLILVQADILKLDLEEFLAKWLSSSQAKTYKLIANIPYYITGAILEKFLSLAKPPEKIVVLVQKEVAERIVAKNQKASILSLAVKFYGEPTIIAKVSKESFYPKPKVDSAILKIDIFKKPLEKLSEKAYFELIKASFAHKRKLLLKNLKAGLGAYAWEEIFQDLNLSKQVRAEDLTKETFLKIVDKMLFKK